MVGQCEKFSCRQPHVLVIFFWSATNDGCYWSNSRSLISLSLETSLQWGVVSYSTKNLDSVLCWWVNNAIRRTRCGKLEPGFWLPINFQAKVTFQLRPPNPSFRPPPPHLEFSFIELVVVGSPKIGLITNCIQEPKYTYYTKL